MLLRHERSAISLHDGLWPRAPRRLGPHAPVQAAGVGAALRGAGFGLLRHGFPSAVGGAARRITDDGQSEAGRRVGHQHGGHGAESWPPGIRHQLPGMPKMGRSIEWIFLEAIYFTIIRILIAYIVT